MYLQENADEIAALSMIFAGIAIMSIGAVTIFILGIEIEITDVVLMGNALLLPASGYLFGKTTPKK